MLGVSYRIGFCCIGEESWRSMCLLWSQGCDSLCTSWPGWECRSRRV